MDRTNWNDGVEVDQAQLAYEHDALATNILQRWTDGADLGIASGLEVTVNGGNPTLVDIAAGHGYVPMGEWVELAAPLTGIALADYTLDADNYVCLVYVETASAPRPHETLGTAFNTQVSRSAQARVYIAATLLALPAESLRLPDGSVDFSVDTRDRLLVVGIVAGNGAAIALTGSNITLAPSTASTDVRSIDQPTLSVPGLLVVGLESTVVATVDATANTTASISYNSGTGVVTYTETETGASDASSDVRGLVDGARITLDPGSGAIEIAVYPTMLPASGSGTLTASGLVVSKLYAPEVVPLSARDELHRRLVGTGLPSATNPHGIRFGDMDDPIVEVPSSLALGTELLSTLVQHLTPRLAAMLDPGVSSRMLLLSTRATSGSASRVRLYVSSARGLEVTVNAYWDGSNWHRDAVGVNSTITQWEATGFRTKGHASSSSSPWADGAWDTAPLELSALVGLAGTLFSRGETVLGDSLMTAAGRDVPRVSLRDVDTTSAGEVRTFVCYLTRQSGANDQNTTRLYRTKNTIGGGAGVSGWEITENAVWDDAGSGVWTKDTGGQGATKFELSRSGLRIVYRDSASAGTWTDGIGGGGWDGQSFQYSATSGLLAVTGIANFYSAVNVLADDVNVAVGDVNVSAGNVNVPAGEVLAQTLELNSNAPSPVLPAQVNNLYADLLPRAWVRIVVTAGVPPTVSWPYEVGIANVAVATGISYKLNGGCTAIDVTLDNTYAGYAVCITGGINAAIANTRDVRFDVLQLSGSSFRIYASDDGNPTPGGGGSFTDAGGEISTYELGVFVFGRY